MTYPQISLPCYPITLAKNPWSVQSGTHSKLKFKTCMEIKRGAKGPMEGKHLIYNINNLKQISMSFLFVITILTSLLNSISIFRINAWHIVDDVLPNWPVKDSKSVRFSKWPSKKISLLETLTTTKKIKINRQDSYLDIPNTKEILCTN